MLNIHLSHLFAARGITNPRAALIKAGISARSAHSILHEYKAHIRFDHLEKLCLLLHCTPHDLLRWQPPATLSHADTHPLAVLLPVQETNITGIYAALRHMPLEELRRLADVITEKKKNGD